MGVIWENDWHASCPVNSNPAKLDPAFSAVWRLLRDREVALAKPALSSPTPQLVATLKGTL